MDFVVPKEEVKHHVCSFQSDFQGFGISGLKYIYPLLKSCCFGDPMKEPHVLLD